MKNVAAYRRYTTYWTAVLTGNLFSVILMTVTGGWTQLNAFTCFIAVGNVIFVIISPCVIVMYIMRWHEELAKAKTQAHE